MPGFYLALDNDRIGTAGDGMPLPAPPSSIIDIPFSGSIIADSGNLILGCNLHDNKSFISFSDESFIIAADGLFLGRSHEELRGKLTGIAESVFIKRSDAEKTVRDFILGTNGEFAVVLMDKKSKAIMVFNDRLGRLPVYYAQDGGRMVVSRNPKHIITMLENRDFDRKAISQYLVFGYPLGNRTVLKGVSQLEGGSLIRWDPDHISLSVTQLFKYNFEKKQSPSIPISTHAENIIQMLHTACRNLIDDSYDNILALSGGLDSRTVAICLDDIKASFSAVTFMDFYEIVKPDVQFATQIARTLDIDQQVVYLPKASGRNALELLNIKCGMNYLGVSFSMTMLEEIMNSHGKRITLFTGDGGDRVLRDTTPVKRLASLEDLVDYTIDSNSVLNPGIVSSLTGIPFEEIRADLRDLFASYEENDLDAKYLHFIFYERCPKWHFQGEDRNRILVRHVAPFYATDLFEYAMTLPDGLKKDFKLYREVLKRLSPSVADIPNPEWNFPITSKKLRAYGLARRMYFHMPETVRKIIQRRHWYTKKAEVYDSETPVMRCLRAQFENSPALQKHFPVDDLGEMTGKMDKTGFDHFITLTSLMELVDRGASSIENYAAMEFI